MATNRPLSIRPRKAPEAAIDQLPLWTEKVRGLPNAMARSALFTVGSKTEPRIFHTTHKQIQSLEGVSISYKGEELRMCDEDAWLQLVHLSRNYPAGEAIEFTAYSFLKELGWSRSSDGYERLRETLDRLQGNGLRISSQKGMEGLGGFQGSLVRKFCWKDESDEPLAKWVVWLEPEIVRLFAQNMHSYLDWGQRLRLRSNVAKYLHSYYHTHENPYPIKVGTLYKLTGSKTKRLTDFRKSLRTALDELLKIGFFTSWEIDKNDLLHVIKPPRRLKDATTQ